MVATSHDPGPLEYATTYYWRVDAFDGIQTYTGPVWSFTTAGSGGGIRAEYYHGMNFETYVMTRIDPQINFDWGHGSPDPNVNADQFSVRWVGEIFSPVTGTVTFWTRSDDGVRLWVNGQLIIENWTDHSPTYDQGSIDLQAGTWYPIQMEMYENGVVLGRSRHW